MSPLAHPAHPRPEPRVARWLTCSLTAIALGVTGCASAGNAGRPRACGLQPADSVFAAAGPVYRDCAVDSKAQPVTPNTKFDFQTERGAAPDACYTAEVEFVVNEAGSPEAKTARVLHTNDQTFAQAFLTAIATWRYRPAVKDGHPVRQIVDERRSVQTATVLVRAGSAPPSRPPIERPRC